MRVTIEDAVKECLTADDLRRVMADEIISYNGRMVSVGDALALHVIDSFLNGVKLKPSNMLVKCDRSGEVPVITISQL